MTTTLPVLPLAHPLILLPTGRVTLPVSKRIGEALLNLVQESEDQPVVAAVPLTSPDSSLYEWGTASRIVRLIKPPIRNPKQPYLLSLNGVTRVRIVDDLSTDLSSGVVHLRVEYPRTDGIPSHENVVKFKASALKLLNQLSRDTTQEVKRESFNKVAALVEDVSQVKAAWIADVILSSTNAEYKDKLGEWLAAGIIGRRVAAGEPQHDSCRFRMIPARTRSYVECSSRAVLSCGGSSNTLQYN